MGKPKTREISESSFTKNYASDESTSARFLEETTQEINLSRDNRLPLEDQWIDDIRLWSCVLDDAGYVGRSNLFVPELHHQIELGVERSLDTMFSNGQETIDVMAMPGTTNDMAEKIKRAVAYELQEKNKLFSKWDEFGRQKQLLGTSVFRGKFEKQFEQVYFKNAKGKTIKDEVPVRHGVFWEVVDLFHWYIYPEVSPTIESAKMIFEDAFVPKSDFDDNEEYVNKKDVQSISRDDKHQWSDMAQLEIVSLATAAERRKDSVLLTEIHKRFKLTERGPAVPVVATIANGHTLVRLKKNPFFFQRAPYAGERYLRRPGKLFYGFSVPDKIRSQNYQMNDLTNHTMDSLSYSLNPIFVIDPAITGNMNSMVVSPGAKWMGDPKGVDTITIPDVSGSGLRAMQEVRGQVAQFSDSTPGVAPQLQGKSRSATQSSIVNQAVSMRQRIATELEEQNVIIPMCQMTHAMLYQFMEKEFQVKYRGPDEGEWIAQTIQPSDLYGRVEFLWKGPSAQQKTAVESQQILALYNLALQTSTVMPGKVDLPALFQKVCLVAFNQRDLGDIFPDVKAKKTVSAEVENLALLEGHDVPVNNGDDDEEHIPDHMAAMEEADGDEAKLAILRHVEKHEVQQAAKAEVEALKSRMDALKSVQGMLGEEEGMGDGREGPAVPSPMEGNLGQMPSSDGAVMGGVRGVEPNEF